MNQKNSMIKAEILRIANEVRIAIFQKALSLRILSTINLQEDSNINLMPVLKLHMEAKRNLLHLKKQNIIKI